MFLNSASTQNRYYISLIITGLYTILPFLILCIFNQPSVDDFEYAVRDNTSSFLSAQVDTYFNWSGRYFSTAISRINPIRFGSFIGYKAASFILILTFLLVLHLFLSHSFKHLKDKQLLSLTAFFSIIYISQMPDISRGFYYMTHYFVYQLPNILTILLAILLIKLFNSNKNWNIILYKTGIIIICIAIIGTLELSLVYIMTSLILLSYQLWRRKHKLFNFLLLVCMISLIASLVMTLAPGNYARMDLSPNDSKKFIWSFMASSILIITYLYKWGLVLIVASIMYALIWNDSSVLHSRYQSWVFKIPIWLSLSCFFTTLFLMNFVYTWSVGGVPKPNVENVIYFYFLLGWFYNLHVILNKLPTTLQIAPHSLFTVSAIALFIRLVLDINNNISTAYLDLISGKAARHNNELNMRYVFLNQSNCKICIVKPLTGMPKSLYIYDLTAKLEEQDLLINSAPTKYWRKESIILSSHSPKQVYNNQETLHSIGRGIKHWLIELWSNIISK